MKAGIKYIIYFIFSATFVVSFVYPKPMTLEKVEDLRLDMIEKKKKKARKAPAKARPTASRGSKKPGT